MSRGLSVINVDVVTYAACLSNLKTVIYNNNYTFGKVDIRREVLNVIFTKHSPNVVMHLAAESHVDRSIDAPVDFIETNSKGTCNMLEASRS